MSNWNSRSHKPNALAVCANVHERAHHAIRRARTRNAIDVHANLQYDQPHRLL